MASVSRPSSEVERDAAAEAGGRHAEAGVAGGVGHAAAERGAEEDREAAAGVDRAAPAVGEAHALELREAWEEVLGEHARSVGSCSSSAGPTGPP